MAKYRALIVGAGRIGAGFGWGPWPYIYTHADAYLALKERVELVGFADSNKERALAAEEKYGLPCFDHKTKCIEAAVEALRPDIVSICTPPENRAETLVQCLHDGLKGFWIEKPLKMAMPIHHIGEWESKEEWPKDFPKVQVNYIRRFDNAHKWYAENEDRKVVELWVWAKKDIHTVCHFTDLARFWGVKKDDLHYFEMNGPNSYAVRINNNHVPDYDRLFPLGGITEGGFMERALSNLLDSIEGKAELISPPESAIESEKWAQEILNELPKHNG